jgi:hypothetical protein
LRRSTILVNLALKSTVLVDLDLMELERLANFLWSGAKFAGSGVGLLTVQVSRFWLICYPNRNSSIRVGLVFSDFKACSKNRWVGLVNGFRHAAVAAVGTSVPRPLRITCH